MSTSSQQVTTKMATVNPLVQDIQVEWDPKTGGVTITPSKVKTGTIVRFTNPKGEKVRIVFLSNGKEANAVEDSNTYTFSTEGTFSFDCFFTAPGSTMEKKSKLGGVIIVTPHVP